MKNIILLMLVSFSFNLLGEDILANTNTKTVPFPDTLPEMKDFKEAFRNVLETKIKDLKKNFISEEDHGFITFRSHEPTYCYHKMAPAGETLATMTKRSELSDNDHRLQEVVTLTGCRGQQVLREVITTTGTDLLVQSDADFKEGKLRLTLNKNEGTRVYILFDHLDRELLKIVMDKNPRIVHEQYIFTLQGNDFYGYSKRANNKYADSFYIFNGFKFHFQFGKSTWYSIFDIERQTLMVESDGVRIRYYDNDKKEITPGIFYKDNSEYAQEKGLKIISSVMSKALFQMLPLTQIIGGAGKNKRILQELEQMRIDVINGERLETVAIYLAQLKIAIETGLIDLNDRRPQKENQN